MNDFGLTNEEKKKL